MGLKRSESRRGGGVSGRRQNFKSALECAMNYTVSCMPSDYRGFMPQPHRMAALVDRLCQNTSGIRFNCVARKAEDLFICGFRKGHAAFRGSNQLVTLEDFLCKAFQFNAECQLQELRACGCATVRLYESLSRDFLYPPNCPRPMLKTGPIACNPRNEALFANNGAKMLQADWTTKLALTIGLSFCLTCICKHALT
ncbi:hypothetical protein RRG08_013212 [Elysia crispata]|uniref:Uncharacterized protein n=1 Tax=Elysia crispata TaxID=231223 RepID=A0AAE1B673_9GAST|nr:hypothetical protein RRG08_013212 [Elysia crispata]